MSNFVNFTVKTDPMDDVTLEVRGRINPSILTDALACDMAGFFRNRKVTSKHEAYGIILERLVFEVYEEQIRGKGFLMTDLRNDDGWAGICGEAEEDCGILIDYQYFSAPDLTDCTLNVELVV